GIGRRESPVRPPTDRGFAIEERACERRAQDRAVRLAAGVLPAKRAPLEERNAQGPEVARRGEAQLSVRPLARTVSRSVRYRKANVVERRYGRHREAAGACGFRSFDAGDCTQPLEHFLMNAGGGVVVVPGAARRMDRK